MNPQGSRLIYCPCSAENPSDATTCWLCQRPLPGQPTSEPGAALSPEQQPVLQSPPTVAPRAFSEAGEQSQFPTIGLWLTLAVVGFGVLLIAPGLAITLAIAACPALIRTAMLVNRRSQNGKSVSGSRRFLLFLGSLGTSVVVLIVVQVAAIGSFCAVCLSSGNKDAVPVAVLFAIVVTIGVLFLCWKWIRRRWQRDIEQG